MQKLHFPLKRVTVVAALLVSGLSLTSVFAANANNQTLPNQKNKNTPSAPSIDSTGIIKAIDRLGDKIQAVAVSAMDFVNRMTYQVDADLPSTITANAKNTVKVDDKTVTPAQYADIQANETTQKNTDNSLAQIAFSITPPKPNFDNMAEIKAYKEYQDKNSITTLSQGTKASDSPYFSSRYTSFIPNPVIRRAISKADNKTLDDNDKIFNYGNLITPTTYSKAEALAASRFIQYATKDFKPLTGDVDFSPMKNATPAQLADLVRSDAFQNFQINVRNTVANRSIVDNILNGLVAERKANENFSVDNGKRKNVSPLEVEKYIATRRTNSTQWYKNMATASPATVQRETLFVLAEIEKQNYQAHLDRERLLSAVTAMSIAVGQANQLAGAEDAQKVNQEIDKVMNIKKSDQTSDAEKKYGDDSDASKKDKEKAKKEAEKAKDKNS